MKKLATHNILQALVTLTLLSFLFGVGACGRTVPAQIEGNIIGLPDTRVYLSVFETSLRIMDSTQSVGGEFTFKLPEILPNVLFVSFEVSPHYYIPIIAEGEDLFISGNFNHNNDIKVYGTVSNDALWEYHQSVLPYDIMLKAVELSIGEYGDSVELRSSTDSLSYIKLLHKRDSINVLLNSSQRQFIQENPASIVSAMFTFRAISDSASRQQIDILLSRLDTVNMRDNAFLRRIYRKKETFER